MANLNLKTIVEKDPQTLDKRINSLKGVRAWQIHPLQIKTDTGDELWHIAYVGYEVEEKDLIEINTRDWKQWQGENGERAYYNGDQRIAMGKDGKWRYAEKLGDRWVIKGIAGVDTLYKTAKINFTQR